MVSIGSQLSQKRQALGLTLEDVAFRTHISVSRLADLENDDLSHFANLTYAKGFLKLYSRHLELNIKQYLDEFDTSELASASGHEYVKMGNTVQNLSPLMVVNDSGRNQLWMTLAITGLLIAAPIIWWTFFKGDDALKEANSQTPTIAPLVPSQAPPPALNIPTVGSPPDDEPTQIKPAIPASKDEVAQIAAASTIAPENANRSSATQENGNPVPRAVTVDEEDTPGEQLRLAEIQLEKLKEHLQAYAKSHQNKFPKESLGLGILVSEKLMTSDAELIDPWGNPFVYRQPAVFSTGSYDLYSRGPDGVVGNEDDVRIPPR